MLPQKSGHRVKPKEEMFRTPAGLRNQSTDFGDANDFMRYSQIICNSQPFPDWLIDPLDKMYHEFRRTRDRDKRFQIYKRANEYIADQALMVFTMAPLTLYGVNEEVEFIPQVSQYLYLDYSSVTDTHWSIRAEKK